MEMFKTLTSVLLAGDNTIEFTDANITDTSILDCYLTDSDLIIEESSQTGTTVSITVSNHSEPVGVALFIINCETFTPYDDTDVQNELLQLGTRVSLLESSMNNKQDKLTAGENISIVNNVISASGGGGGAIDYTTTEQDTGLKWIDGKTIYQCTIQGNGNGRYLTITHNLGVDKYIEIQGGIKVNSANERYQPYPFMQYQWGGGVTIENATNNSIVFWGTWNLYSAYLTIRYTKEG